MKNLVYGFGVLLLVWSANATAGSIHNGGFETGDFTGWTVTIPTGIVDIYGYSTPAGTAGIVSSSGVNFYNGAPPYSVRTANFTDIPPVQGSYFASVGSGNTLLAGNGTYDISMSQSVSLDQGDSLSGWAFFFNGDFVAQDTAWVKILDGDGNQISEPWFDTSGATCTGSNAGIPYGQTGPWTFWQWQAPATGTYTIEMGVTTLGDDEFDSTGFFDGLAIDVPEPGTGSLFLLGAGLMLWRRRRA